MEFLNFKIHTYIGTIFNVEIHLTFILRLYRARYIYPVNVLNTKLDLVYKPHERVVKLPLNYMMKLKSCENFIIKQLIRTYNILRQGNKKECE